MGYLAGETILDNEYNEFLNNTSGVIGINHTMGVGATVYGLGQTELPTVTADGGADSKIKAAQWNALLTAMDNIANHTNISVTARTQVTAGDTVKIKAAVATDLTALRRQWQAVA